MALVIDRFEEGLAVLEDTETFECIECPVANLPKGAREGDVLTKSGEGYLLDPKETEARILRIKEKMKRLKKN
ncbi:MAG: DUF3006 domain-containing protein [Defluviitaleaceae bacterium]|nr:DUF3006 domain-containing protein [Defluviitaleaceae bacterium]